MQGRASTDSVCRGVVDSGGEMVGDRWDNGRAA